MMRPYFTCGAIAALLVIPLNTAFADDSKMIRELCKDGAARALLQSQLDERDREDLEWTMSDRCPRIDLPSKPIHDPADASDSSDSSDASREASHTDWTYDANYSADGKRIVSAGRDGTVRIWDTETGKSLQKITIPKETAVASTAQDVYVRSAMFLADSKNVAAASDHKAIGIFDAASGAPVTELPFPTIDPAETFPPDMANAAQGLLLLAGNNDEVLGIDPASKEVKLRLPGHAPRAGGVTISQAAGLIATSSENKAIQLWRSATGEKLVSVSVPGQQHPGKLFFSRDGKQLAVIAGGSIHLYSVPDLKLVRTIVEHPMYSVYDVDFTPDGTGLLACRSHMVLWDIASGKIVRHYGPFNDLCHSIDVSPDGKYAVTTSMTSDLKVWDIATGAFERRLGIDVRPPR